MRSDGSVLTNGSTDEMKGTDQRQEFKLARNRAQREPSSPSSFFSSPAAVVSPELQNLHETVE
jgi:hypothetical protein